MTESLQSVLTSVIAGGIGAAIGTVFQYAFGRYKETQQIRREIVETRLLQLQNAVESLYYRSNNLLDHDGRGTMSDEYYMQTSAYAFAIVLAQEALLVSTGTYAKIQSDEELKSTIKGALHQLNSAMDPGGFHHYYRVQLGEMATDDARILTYTEFLERWNDPKYLIMITVLRRALDRFSEVQSERMRNLAGGLVGDLTKKTGVPSALSLMGSQTSRAPYVTSAASDRKSRE